VKRIIISVAAIIAFMAVAPNAHAIGVYGQWWDSDTAGDGFGIGIKQKVFGIPMVKIDVRGTWVNFSDASTDVIPLEATANLGGLVYGGVGIGYYIISPDTGDADNQFGGSIQLGVELAPVKFGGFAEIRYSWLADSSSLDGVNANLGVIWNF
jgi:hypothetical protein